MFHSIRWRIAITFVALILVCIIGFSLYLSHFFEQSYLENLETQLADQAYLIADSTEQYISSDNAESIDLLAKRLGEQIDTRITIIAHDGLVLGDSEENPAAMENHADRPEIIEALSQGTGSAIRYSTTLGFDMMYVAVPLMEDGDVLGTARVSLPLTEIHNSLGHINITIAWVGVVAALITILLALQISKVITNPVKKLTRAARRMADGELEQEIGVTSPDEVGELARSLNSMAAKIKGTITLITTERDKMAAALSHMGDGILVVDDNSVVTLMNTAAETMLQVSEEKAIGRTFINVVQDYELDEILQRCMRTQEQQTGTVEFSPERRFLGVVATPLESDSGCLLLLRDLTELRRLETVRRDFVSNISHELRTPITSLKALAETLGEGAIGDPSVAKGFLSQMNTELDRLAQMVEELGELSRIESGEAHIHSEPFDIADAIKQATTRLSAQADRAGLTLDISVPSDLPQALGDRNRIEQVLVNLIHNAIKFTGAGGSIHVSADYDADKLQVSVSDNGIGIPADDLPRIFERFYKADKARSSKGTGLGLAIVKHIIETHGGEFRAESTEGKGSKFSFTLNTAPDS